MSIHEKQQDDMKGYVYYNQRFLAGILDKTKNGYIFTYDGMYFKNPEMPRISTSFPKTKQSYFSPYLFPFFSGLLAEGTNKLLQCRLLKIDERDEFTRLLKTAGYETIGAITVREK